MLVSLFYKKSKQKSCGNPTDYTDYIIYNQTSGNRKEDKEGGIRIK